MPKRSDESIGDWILRHIAAHPEHIEHIAASASCPARSYNKEDLRKVGRSSQA